MIEQTAKEAVKDQLSVGETTVGTVLELRHLYPSAVGATIVVTMTALNRLHTKYAMNLLLMKENDKLPKVLTNVQ